MLYQKAADSIANKLYLLNCIRDEDREVYAYCIEILFSTVVDLLSVFLLSILFHRTLPTLFFLIGFFASRAFCGGYHANHHITCFLTFLADYTLFLLFDCFICSFHHRQIVLICMQLFALVMISLFSPVDHPNNPMTEEQIRKGRKRNRIVFVLFSAAVIALCVWIPNTSFLPPVVFGVFSTACALGAAVCIKKQGGEKA